MPILGRTRDSPAGKSVSELSLGNGDLRIIAICTDVRRREQSTCSRGFFSSPRGRGKTRGSCLRAKAPEWALEMLVLVHRHEWRARYRRSKQKDSSKDTRS